ncbi:hypothetical protein GCM10010329_50230 [Streptomyces spiroverticillatus]|uniref:Uncharacterized protein n=1 Tax=Streptomyces finlayi TaxID=67296 RepID=A0A919CC78_9ACTN|nr:hypothetical protein [Streptomyces finlayi]GHA20782.1 hypothetical protein GCM10010329_50230 [Streptomyces spiroverticillatus]GHD03433.1 hypothetical protein GCM10010334_51180 [Streptomyces finlayi]
MTPVAVAAVVSMSLVNFALVALLFALVSRCMASPRPLVAAQRERIAVPEPDPLDARHGADGSRWKGGWPHEQS